MHIIYACSVWVRSVFDPTRYPSIRKHEIFVIQHMCLHTLGENPYRGFRAFFGQKTIVSGRSPIYKYNRLVCQQSPTGALNGLSACTRIGYMCETTFIRSTE